MKKILNEINEYLQRKSLFGYLMHNTFSTLILIFVASFGFLFLFKPYFLVNYHLKPFLILITGYSFIASISYALSYTIFSPHNKSIWTKQLEIGLFALSYFIAWLMIWGYTIINVEFFFKDVYEITRIPPLPENVGLTLLLYTIVIGLLLYLVIHSYDILITHEKLGLQERAIENAVVRMNRLGCKVPNKIRLNGKNGKDKLEIDFSQFVLAEVEEHYIKISYICCEGTVKYHWLRNSMRAMEIQLGNADKWLRCHKSYIINIEHAHKIKRDSNKNKALLYMNYYPDPIPISVKKIDIVQSDLEFNEVENSDS